RASVLRLTSFTPTPEGHATRLMSSHEHRRARLVSTDLTSVFNRAYGATRRDRGEGDERPRMHGNREADAELCARRTMQQGRVSSLARQHIEADVRCVIDGFE